MTEDNDDGQTGGIVSLLLAPVRFIVLAVAWVLAVLWAGIAALWDALTGDPDVPEDDG